MLHKWKNQAKGDVILINMKAKYHAHLLRVNGVNVFECIGQVGTYSKLCFWCIDSQTTYILNISSNFYNPSLIIQTNESFPVPEYCIVRVCYLRVIRNTSKEEEEKCPDTIDLSADTTKPLSSEDDEGGWARP